MRRTTDQLLHASTVPEDASTKQSLHLVDAEQKRWMTTEQVASYLGVSIRTVRTWLSEGTIPHVRLPGRFVRFDREAIDEWARSFAVPTTPRANRSYGKTSVSKKTG